MKKRYKFMANKITLKCNKHDDIVTYLARISENKVLLCDFLIYFM